MELKMREIIDSSFVAFELVDKMVLFWITLVLALSGSNAEGELRILHSPASLKFKPRGETRESTLKEIFSAALGLSVAYDSEWDGLEIMDPFDTPEAAVEVHIDGIAGLGENVGLNAEIFPLLVDEYEPDTFRGVKLRIKQRFDVGGNEIVNFKLNEVTKFNRIKTVFGKVDGASYKMIPLYMHLRRGVSEDRQFLTELRTLRAVIEKVKDGVLSPDTLIDFYNFRFRSLHTLSDYYGPFSNQTKEATKLLGDALQELNKAFVKAYNGSVLVTVVTTEVAHSRRSARAVTTNPLGRSQKWPYNWPEEKKTKVAQTSDTEGSDVERVGVEGRSFRADSPGYTETSSKPPYRSSPELPEHSADETIESEPVPISLIERTDKDENIASPHLPEANAAMFNLFLYIGGAWFFSMLAIIYTLMDMDPGRDTIIYRMTATRQSKKDV